MFQMASPLPQLQVQLLSQLQVLYSLSLSTSSHCSLLQLVPEWPPQYLLVLVPEWPPQYLLVLVLLGFEQVLVPSPFRRSTTYQACHRWLNRTVVE
jgi:hypothetical protein